MGRCHPTARIVGWMYVVDLREPRWMYLKAVLLLGVGVIASFLIWLECPRWRTVGLLALSTWGFCRAYYFAFYVIGHYIDREFRFAALSAVARYVVQAAFARRADGCR